MDETSGGNLSAYVPDPEMFRYAKAHAARMRMTVSAYLNLLIEIDCNQDIARKEMLRRITDTTEKREAVAS